MNNFHYMKTNHTMHMFSIDHPELIKLAMKQKGLNQTGLAHLIGKSQAQISKYLNQTSIPSDAVIIRIMNIISESPPEDGHFFELLRLIYTLNGEQHKNLRIALTKTIDAYNSASRKQLSDH